MKKIVCIVALLLISDVSLSKSCWIPYLMAEKAKRENIHIAIEEGPETRKEEKDIYDVVSDLSEYMFIGEALSTIKTTFREKGGEASLFKVVTKFSVSETIKGKLKPKITVYGAEAGDCGCRYEFEPGVKYFVIANKVKEKLVTYYCEYIKPKDRAFVEEFKKVNKKTRSTR